MTRGQYSEERIHGPVRLSLDWLRSVVAYCFDLAKTAANITTASAGSVAFFAVTDCDAGDVRFATTTADGAGRRPLASTSGT